MKTSTKSIFFTFLVLGNISVAYSQSTRDQLICVNLSAYVPIALNLKESGFSKRYILNELNDIFYASYENSGRDLFNSQYYLDFSEDTLKQINEGISRAPENISDAQLENMLVYFNATCIKTISN